MSTLIRAAWFDMLWAWEQPGWVLKHHFRHFMSRQGKFTWKSYLRLLFFRLFSISTNLLSLISASSFLPPARMGIGGGSMMEMVLALFVLAEICVFWVDTMFKLTLLSLLLLLFWLLLMLARKEWFSLKHFIFDNLKHAASFYLQHFPLHWKQTWQSIGKPSMEEWSKPFI